jgi:hypothetical protein
MPEGRPCRSSAMSGHSFVTDAPESSLLRKRAAPHIDSPLLRVLRLPPHERYPQVGVACMITRGLGGGWGPGRMCS